MLTTLSDSAFNKNYLDENSLPDLKLKASLKDAQKPIIGLDDDDDSEVAESTEPVPYYKHVHSCSINTKAHPIDFL